MPSPPARSISKAEPPAAPQPVIDARQLRGGMVAWLVRAVTGGDDARVLFWSWAPTSVVVILICLLDVSTRIHLAALRNLTEPVWQPIIDEYSSGLVIIALFPLVARLATLATPWDGRALRFWSVHLPGALAFSLIHVAGLILIRTLVYGLLGILFEFGGLGAFFYEFPRDVIAYGLCAGGVWGVLVLLQKAAPAAMAPSRAVFDIRDNAKVLRVPIDDILAVRSAGNYVEFLLADGRRPLMRQTLAETAQQLTPHGLARTHRSWLVNKGRIAQIEPAGSGDFKLTLGEGVEAPLSRRFKGAIEG